MVTKYAPLAIIVALQPNAAMLMTLGMKPHRYCYTFKGITLTTSFPRKSITFTAIRWCLPG
jgi:hypothetical protein